MFSVGGALAAAGEVSLQQEWRQIRQSTDGTVGAAALDLASGRLVSMYGDEPFPLASVCKVPIAMNILALVDEGKLALNQEIEWSQQSATRWPIAASSFYRMEGSSP